MKLPEQYDVILGNAFLKQTRAVSEHDAHGLKRMTLHKGNRKFTVNRPESSALPEVSAPLLSAMQLSRALRKKERCFLVRVTEKVAESVLMAHASTATSENPNLIPADKMQSILERFKTVLVDDLPLACRQIEGQDTPFLLSRVPDLATGLPEGCLHWSMLRLRLMSASCSEWSHRT